MQSAQKRLFLVALMSCIVLVPNEYLCAETRPMLVAEGAEWEYWVAASPSDSWNAVDFDSSSWKRGAAPLGYGDQGIVSDVQGDQKAEPRVTTAYFRHVINVDDPKQFKRVALHARFDDGCIVFLNGIEIARLNMPPGKIEHQTAAVGQISGDDERIHWRVLVDADKLRPGRNVFAATVRQASATSSDLWWQAEVVGFTEHDPKTPRISTKAATATRTYHEHHLLNADLTVPDGFVDGGRGMAIQDDGFVKSRREVITVDRQRDVLLQKHLKYAASDELKSLSEVDRATRLARYIDKELSNEEGRDIVNATEYYLSRLYAGQEVLLGDVVRYCGGGVCRHRSLLFKIMADEAGLQSSLVRGNYGVDELVGGHAWNELKLQNGDTVIVDVMNPEPDFYFPKTDEPALRHYLTIDGQAYYPQAVENAKKAELPREEQKQL